MINTMNNSDLEIGHGSKGRLIRIGRDIESMVLWVQEDDPFTFYFSMNGVKNGDEPLKRGTEEEI